MGLRYQYGTFFLILIFLYLFSNVRLTKSYYFFTLLINRLIDFLFMFNIVRMIYTILAALYIDLFRPHV
jgi:hypothetical protein